MTPTDMAKFGQLYLAGGVWQGRQVVPADWVATSTAGHVDTGNSTWPGYGYQWWVMDAGGHPAFAAVGFAGQLIEVVPDLDLVVVVACLNDPAGFEADAFVQFVENAIVPALGWMIGALSWRSRADVPGASRVSIVMSGGAPSRAIGPQKPAPLVTNSWVDPKE